MAMKFPPRIKETTSITGTGDYILDGAASGYSEFSRFLSDQDTTFYCCTDGVEWEMAVGRYDSATNAIQRINIYSGDTSTGTIIDWGAGAKDIFIIFPHWLLERLVSGGGYGAFVATSESIGIGSANFIDETIRRSICLGYNNSCYEDNTYTIGYCGDNTISGTIVLASNEGSQIQFTSDKLTTTDENEETLPIKLAHASLGSNEGSSTLFELSIVARQSAGSSGTVGDSKAWKLYCLIAYDTYTPAMIGSLTKTVIAESAGASAWDVSIIGGSPTPVRVTGEANKTIAWVVNVQGVGVKPPAEEVA